MSRGLGQIERVILDEIMRDLKPGPHGNRGTVLVSSHSVSHDHALPGHEWGGPWRPSRARRQAVVRAMHSFVRKFPQYALTGGQGRCPLYLYDPADPLSAFWAQLRIERGFVSRSEAQRLMKKRDIGSDHVAA
jgi:hypothetical protein